MNETLPIVVVIHGANTIAVTVKTSASVAVSKGSHHDPQHSPLIQLLVLLHNHRGDDEQHDVHDQIHLMAPTSLIGTSDSSDIKLEEL